MSQGDVDFKSAWWCIPAFPALGFWDERIVSSRPAEATQKPHLTKQNPKQMSSCMRQLDVTFCPVSIFWSAMFFDTFSLFTFYKNLINITFLCNFHSWHSWGLQGWSALPKVTQKQAWDWDVGTNHSFLLATSVDNSSLHINRDACASLGNYVYPEFQFLNLCDI